MIAALIVLALAAPPTRAAPAAPGASSPRSASSAPDASSQPIASPAQDASSPSGSPAPQASVPPSPEVRARVRALLGVIDRPVSPEAIRAAGPGAEEALAEIALGSELPVRRARALEALAGLRSRRAEELHRRFAGDAAAPRTVRRSAVNGLAALLAPDAAAEALRPVLEKDRDPGMRAAAAAALARRAPSRGCPLVRAQVAREPQGDRGRFRQAVAACRGR